VRVKIESDGTAFGTKVIDKASGVAICASAVTFHSDLNKGVGAIVRLALVEVQLETDAKFEIVDPIDGLTKTVKRVEYADGTFLDL
jgi:hypothetical protein